MSSTFEVGTELVKLCQQGENLKAIETLYADDVESIEVEGTEEMPAEMKGIDAVKGKNQWWLENHEVHGSNVAGPYPHGDRFIITYEIDITPKVGPMAGQRMQMTEAGLYTVKDGKVIKEEFFYHMGP